MDHNLYFAYKMDLEFSDYISNHHFVNKIEPTTNLRQRIVRVRYRITPYESIGTCKDGFGNQVVYGNCLIPHDRFQIIMEGEAITCGPGAEEQADDKDLAIYKYPTRFTMPGEYLSAYFRYLQKKAGKAISTWSSCRLAEYYMEELRQRFSYRKGLSSIETEAEEAMRLGNGVCQDYAHILLALLRMSKVPAKYVVGLMNGEGESHAWVEVYQDGFWYGIDPTNGIWVDGNYIKISSGRDYHDCIISKGSFIGTVTQTQSVSASVSGEKGKNKLW